MKLDLLFLILVTLSSCSQVEPKEKESVSIVGTWELISATTIQGDSSLHDDLSGKRMIKIINESHFAFLNHDIYQGKDSLALFVSGGGKYQLSGNRYTEFLEYCNFRVWEENKFEFDVEVRGDTLIQRGIEKIENLGVDREIIEVYLKSDR